MKPLHRKKNVLIPGKIQPYFDIRMQKSNDKDDLIEGSITCCNAHNFEVFVTGKVQRSIFSKMHVLQENDEMFIEAHCKNCGKIISIFNNRQDGYEKYNGKSLTQRTPAIVHCPQCLESDFSVNIKYEYPAIEELKELGIEEMDNAFTWISINLECCKCGKRYNNFVDYEAD